MSKPGARLVGVVWAVLAVFTIAALPGAADAAAGGDNAAVAVNTKDGSSVFKIAFSVRRVTDGTVNQQNAAVAYARCTECQTVAVAIQVILVQGQASEVTPTNVAVAFNDNCTSCLTMALAFQYVFGNGQEVEFTKEGKERLTELRKQLHDLSKRDDLATADIPAALKPITDGIGEVLRTELQPRSENQGVATSTTTTTTTTAEGATSTTAERTTTTTTASDGDGTGTSRATTTTTSRPLTTTSSAPSSSSSSSTATTPTTGGTETTATTAAGT